MPRGSASGGSRPLPAQPNLRYLKLEAKRRLAAGEFPALHDAQIAIAWEHGLPSWTALKQRVSDQAGRDCPVLPQLSWLVARFRQADQADWTPPGEPELRQHFAPEFLAARPGPELVAAISSAAPMLREELAVVTQTPLTVQVRIGGLDVFAVAAPDPPHRLTGLMAVPLGRRISDPRMAGPARARLTGDVPAGVAQIADEAAAELGLPGLTIAGGGPGTAPWLVTKGWADLDRADLDRADLDRADLDRADLDRADLDRADLDRGELLGPAHRWPAYCGSALLTATAVLRLVAGGRIALDAPVNDQIATVRLEDPTLTVRELLTHTGGVDSPEPSELLAGHVPDLVSVTGPVVACSGPRGVVRPSNGGYAVLGQLIADVTGTAYAEAVTRLVLGPLGLTGPSFPARAADLGPDAVTGYTATASGAIAPVRAMICVLPAIGGLWCTAAELVRLGTGWSSLLPAELAGEAVRPQTGPMPGGQRMGLGWIISPRGDLAVHGGAAPPASTFLRLNIRTGQVQVILASRLIGLGQLSDRLLRSGAPATR